MRRGKRLKVIKEKFFNAFNAFNTPYPPTIAKNINVACKSCNDNGSDRYGYHKSDTHHRPNCGKVQSSTVQHTKRAISSTDLTMWCFMAFEWIVFEFSIGYGERGGETLSRQLVAAEILRASPQNDAQLTLYSLKRSTSPFSTLRCMAESSAMTGEINSSVSLTALFSPSPLMR